MAITIKTIIRDVDNEILDNLKNDLIYLQSEYVDFKDKTAQKLNEFSMKGTPFLQKLKKEINEHNEKRIKDELLPEKLVMMAGNIQYNLDQKVSEMTTKMNDYAKLTDTNQVIRSKDYIRVNSGTVTRNAQGYITKVVVGGRDIDITRDANNYITKAEDSQYKWEITRDSENKLTSWAGSAK